MLATFQSAPGQTALNHSGFAYITSPTTYVGKYNRERTPEFTASGVRKSAFFRLDYRRRRSANPDALDISARTQCGPAGNVDHNERDVMCHGSARLTIASNFGPKPTFPKEEMTPQKR